MNRSSTVFLQGVIVLLGVGVLAFMLWVPQVEGRNANATQFEVYFKDPLLAYAYIASIPFFVALYRAFALLGYAGRNEIFSLAAVRALRTIKYCAIAIIAFVVVSVAFMPFGEPEPPGVVMRGLVIFGAIIVATAAAMFERVLRNAVDIKSENDLTV